MNEEIPHFPEETKYPQTIALVLTKIKAEHARHKRSRRLPEDWPWK